MIYMTTLNAKDCKILPTLQKVPCFLPSSAHGKLVLAPHWYNIENHCSSLPCTVKHVKTTIMIFIVVLPCMVSYNSGFPCYTSAGQALVYHEHYLVKQGTFCSDSEFHYKWQQLYSYCTYSHSGQYVVHTVHSLSANLCVLTSTCNEQIEKIGIIGTV